MKQKRKQITFQKYILAGLIALMFFALGFFVSGYINDRRFLEIDRVRKDFQIQILDMESQLTHFEEVLCVDIGDDILTHELHIIGEKLEFMAGNLGREHPEVLHLKKYYSLLQVRHYRFSQQLCERCDLGLVHLLYFFGDEEICPDCQKQGVILSYLRTRHPKLRIYSFDYELELLALAAIRPSRPDLTPDPDPASGLDPDLKQELVIEHQLPVMVIEGQVFWGFRGLEEMEELLAPKL